jgi:hypothetical protein
MCVYSFPTMHNCVYCLGGHNHKEDFFYNTGITETHELLNSQTLSAVLHKTGHTCPIKYCKFTNVRWVFISLFLLPSVKRKHESPQTHEIHMDDIASMLQHANIIPTN